MATKRGVAAGLVLFLEGGLAGLGVLWHYGFTETYGNTHASVLTTWATSFGDGGVSGVTLALVLALVTPAYVFAAGRTAKVFALSAPLVMVLAMLAVTPLALEEKRQERRGPLGPRPGAATCVGGIVAGCAEQHPAERLA